eukprot:scaffold994_cov226-Prasinococcus_capsulatus_cf.AAC.4
MEAHVHAVRQVASPRLCRRLFWAPNDDGSPLRCEPPLALSGRGGPACCAEGAWLRLSAAPALLRLVP